MMHGPHAVALSLFCLLVSRSTIASTDCAWVLWGQTVDPWNALATLPRGARTSRDQCEEERSKRENAAEELQIATCICLLDTIDPRGPKAKRAERASA